MFTRRELLQKTAQLSAVLALQPQAITSRADESEGVEVNDVQSQLNVTRVARIVQPESVDAVQAAVRDATRQGRAISMAGGRHAIGGQQFGTDTILLDMKRFNRVVSFDRATGRIAVGGGMEWPELLDYLQREQEGQPKQWSIRQKQTGVDRVSMGGSLAANIHGRGLRFPPIISDVESFVLVDAEGKARTCSRRENSELFGLAIGGYGLFGVIAHVALRLVPRTKVQRIVKVMPVRDLLDAVDQRVQQGFLYGDCQYSTDLETDSQMHPGVFSCYKPVDNATPIAKDQKKLSEKEWTHLYTLARTDRKKAFETYSSYYLSTSGQIYGSDTHQLSGTLDYYHQGIKLLPDPQKGTEMLTEVYVMRGNLVPFLRAARKDFLEHKVDLTYGTIRFIEKDDESFLAWAKEQCVCIVCNLHVIHTAEGVQKAPRTSAASSTGPSNTAAGTSSPITAGPRESRWKPATRISSISCD